MVLDNVTFTSTSSDPDGSIVLTQWDFTNDGIFDATGSQVNHAYLFGGDYTVRMKVTDNEGAVKELTKVVSVGTPPNDPPTANFSVSPASPKTLENVTFDSTSSDSDGTIVSYELGARRRQRLRRPPRIRRPPRSSRRAARTRSR